MGRGHSNTRRGALRLRTPRHRAGAPDGSISLPKLRADLAAETAAQLARVAEEARAVALTLGDSDERASEDNFAPFRAAAALYANNPADPHIAGLLTQTLAAQKEHLRQLTDLSQPQTYDPCHPLLRTYRIRADDTPPESTLRIYRAKLLALNRAIERILSGSADGIETSRLGRAAANLRSHAQENALNSLLGRVLAEPGGHHAVLALLDELPSTTPAVDSGTLRAYARLARADQVRGEHRDWLYAICGPDIDRAGVEFEIARFELPRRRGHELRGPALGGERVLVAPLRPRRCLNADDALAAAHGILRTSSDAAQLSWRLKEVANEELAVCANVIVGGAAFAELVDRFHERPDWAGICAFRSESPNSVEGDENGADADDVAVGDPASAGAVMLLKCQIDRRNVDVRFFLPVGGDPGGDNEDGAGVLRIAARLEALVGSDAPNAHDLSSVGWFRWEGHHLEWADATDPSGSSRPERRGREDLLGPDRCRHEGATWLTESELGIPTYQRLACPRCLRGQVASAPAHLRPDGTTDPIVKDPYYQRDLHAQAAFFGEPFPEQITAEEIAARGRDIPMCPTAYSDPPESPMAGRRGRPPGLSPLAPLGGRQR